MKIKNRTSPKTDPLGTRDKTGTGLSIFEHEVLGHFLLHLCCCVQGVSIDLCQVQRRVSYVVVQPDIL